MDDIKDQFNAGRTQMITAFTKAMGYVSDPDLRTELSGQFFDGHVEMKRAFGVMCLKAHLELPAGWERWWDADTDGAAGERQEQSPQASPRVPK